MESLQQSSGKSEVYHERKKNDRDKKRQLEIAIVAKQDQVLTKLPRCFPRKGWECFAFRGGYLQNYYLIRQMSRLKCDICEIEKISIIISKKSDISKYADLIQNLFPMKCNSLIVKNSNWCMTQWNFKKYFKKIYPTLCFVTTEFRLYDSILETKDVARILSCCRHLGFLSFQKCRIIPQTCTLPKITGIKLKTLKFAQCKPIDNDSLKEALYSVFQNLINLILNSTFTMSLEYLQYSVSSNIFSQQEIAKEFNCPSAQILVSKGQRSVSISFNPCFNNSNST
ncbi:unnamed protein product [Moneuplotes crassus]|uniref:Uncharacterized protein n=1 Tax=Euplotes crassus TaxID=5936 RepID=A0AAD2D715_EUPCR|nr:unnamed protein product [Moneuplotes crassus]